MADAAKKVLFADPGTGQTVELPILAGAIEWKHTVAKKFGLNEQGNVFSWDDVFNPGPEGQARQIKTDLEQHLREIEGAMARVIEGERLLDAEGIEGFDVKLHLRNLRIIQKKLDAAVEAGIEHRKSIEKLTSEYPTR